LKKLEGLTEETRGILKASLENRDSRGITVAELRKIDKVCKILEQETETIEFEDEDFNYLKQKFQSFDAWLADPKAREMVLKAADTLGI